MLGWPSLAAERISRRKRSAAPAWPRNCGLTTLRTSGRSINLLLSRWAKTSAAAAASSRPAPTARRTSGDRWLARLAGIAGTLTALLATFEGYERPFIACLSCEVRRPWRTKLLHQAEFQLVTIDFI